MELCGWDVCCVDCRDGECGYVFYGYVSVIVCFGVIMFNVWGVCWFEMFVGGWWLFRLVWV